MCRHQREEEPHGFRNVFRVEENRVIPWDRIGSLSRTGGSPPDPCDRAPRRIIGAPRVIDYAWTLTRMEWYPYGKFLFFPAQWRHNRFVIFSPRRGVVTMHGTSPGFLKMIPLIQNRPPVDTSKAAFLFQSIEIVSNCAHRNRQSLGQFRHTQTGLFAKKIHQ